MHDDVRDLQDVAGSQAALVGGKGAHLGELARIAGVRVPRGFCVTTSAFERVSAQAPTFRSRLERLSRVAPDDTDAIRALSAETRGAVEGLTMPEGLMASIEAAHARVGSPAACAVRSSATAEDLPTASFAGQHDTYLDVGPAAIVDHVRRCWASLFNERAVAYRLRNGVDHRKVRMGVVVQEMVVPRAAGVLFTADPVTGHRKVACVEASLGRGESFVSGRVNADLHRVRDRAIVARTIRADPPALTDEQVVRLVDLGRRIEAHFARPQDVEWCLVGDDFAIVQSRPITTLFPVPDVADGANHVWISVGHQQMMTDPMKPLGLSIWNLTTPRPMAVAGGRLFVDATQALASEPSRTGLLDMAGRSDPLIRDALQTLVDRGDFIRPLPNEGPAPASPVPVPAPIETDPGIVADLIARSEESIAVLEREIRGKSGPELLDFILADLRELKRLLFEPLVMRVIMAAMEATWWLDDRLQAWLGETRAADVLTLSAPNNVTSQMGLALLDVADVIRPHAGVVAFLEQVESDDFLDELPRIAGGRAARDAIRGWLERYGMRGAGEIDITRPRWSERPRLLLPLILGHVRSAEPGEAARRVEAGRQRAGQKERDLLARLRALPDGDAKAEETKRRIDRVRAFIGYREYPKYAKVRREFVYKQALLREAERLVDAHVLRERDDVFFLTVPEIHDVVRTRYVDERLIRERKDAFESYRALTPPRVLTSDGEAVAGAYRRDGLPAGALVGLPVSAGIVEGRARVVVDLANAPSSGATSWSPRARTRAGPRPSSGSRASSPRSAAS